MEEETTWTPNDIGEDEGNNGRKKVRWRKWKRNSGESKEFSNGWKPTRGTVLQVELDRFILSELKRLSEENGVNSIYQMLRNICYDYINAHKRKEIEKA